MISRILLLLFLCGSGFSLSAQKLDSLSSNSDIFIKELETYMTSSKRKQMEDAFKEFEKYFKSGLFTDEEFAQIVKTTNLMLGQKMKPAPYFLGYTEALTKVKGVENGAVRFIEWHSVLDQMLTSMENRKVKPYDTFLKFSGNFFGNKSLKGSDAGVNWSALAHDYQLLYENGAPVIKYDEMNLIASRKGDTITINKTAGIFYPIDLLWKGVGGKVDWDRYNLKDVYVELDTYQINVKKSLYEVKNVTMHYPDFFGDKGVRGHFKDKISSQNKATVGSYPRFESYDDVLKVDNLGEGVEYEGGFRLHGTTVYGFGKGDNKAEIVIRDASKTKLFRAEAPLFVLRAGEQLSAERAFSVVYLDEDSIFHPSVNMKYDVLQKEMRLYRGKRGSDRNPFFSSYHQINMDVDNIDWKMDRDSLVFGKRSVSFANSKEMSLESLKYFKQDDFRRIQNISSTNPISIIKLFAEEEGTNFISANRLAARLNPKYDVTSIQSLLYDLVAKGFINYNSDKEIVEVKDKVYHYVNAYAKQVDHDLLKILSKTDSTNAVMRVSERSIETNAVRFVEFSEIQKVAVKPFKEKIVVKKNRDIDFDGTAFAGYSIFEGKDFSFVYDKNHIEMDSVRFFDLFILTEEGMVDKEGNPREPEPLSIGSRIEHSTGVLLIDAPSNKSSKEDIPIFPSYQSKGPSYVFYDYEQTLNGVYTRDSFFFELNKFSFNSLDDYGKDDIHFKGMMHSFDIFPPFKETLLLREEDESLGFVHTTPASGFPCYLGKGTYTGDIDLSNAGFFAKGNINYLSASINSEDITLKPKQLTASADLFALEEDRTSELKVPHTRGYDVSIDWRPYQDSMYVRSKERPFELFNKGVHTLKGLLILTPGGLKGRGLFDWDKASLSSQLMTFGPFSVTSDTADLKIKAIGSDDLAFDTRGINANLDFDKNIGFVKSNVENNITTMPFNQYQTSLVDFIWDMTEETVTFKNESGTSGVFTSIHPDQDSLNFTGKTAFYDLKSNELLIGDVPYVQTSDAYVYLEDGKVEINPGGKMTTLNNAKIVADTITKYHVINRATVDVLGKKEYRASGFYEYNIGDKTQEIEFANIIGTRVGKGKRDEKKSVTRANGEVKETDNFYIDHKTAYQGKISLSADSKNLDFDGFAKLDSERLPGAEWFSVKFEGDKNDLAIEYNVPKNSKGDPLRTGIFLSKENGKAYPRVMMPLLYRKDRVLMEAKGEGSGLFKYHKAKDQFTFGDSLKIASDVPHGNKMYFDNDDGEFKTEGQLNIGSGLNYVSVTAAGEASGVFEEGNHDLKYRMMAGIKLIFPDKVMKIMENDLKSSSFDARPIDYVKSTDFFEHALAEFVPSGKDYKNTRNAMINSGLDLPKKHDDYTFLFSDLPMVWNADYQSFVTSKNEVGLSSVNGEVINRMLKCYIEFKMPSNEDDRLYIYINSPSEFYYFFGFKQGILSVVSSNTKFMDALLGLKKKELTKKMDDGETYEIQIVNPGSAEMFVTRARAARN